MKKNIHNNILITSLFICTLCLTPDTSKSADADPELSNGISLVQTGQYEEGATLLRKVLEKTPDNPEGNFYLGMALNRTSPDKEAESYLKHSLMENPANAALNYELGLHYYEKDIKAEAADYFEQVLELAPGTEIASNSARYLKQINDDKQLKNWDISIFAGGQYDSNVILNGSGMPLPQGYSNKSDWSAIANVRANYSPVKTDKSEIGIGYSFYQNLHAKLHALDITQNVVEFSGSHDLGDGYRIKGVYSLEYLLLDGKEYDLANSIAPSLIVKNDFGTTTVDYKFRFTKYRNSDQYQTNTDRDGYNHTIGATHILPISDTAALWGLYTSDIERTRIQQWDYYGNRFLLGARSMLPAGLIGDLSAELYLKDYRGYDPLYSATRHDTLYTFTASVAKNFSEHYNVSLSEIWSKNSSNIPVFDYRRSITSLLLNIKF